MYKMSQKLEVGDHIKIGGLHVVIEERNAYSSVNYDMEIIAYLWIAPAKKIIVGLPKDIPIKVKI